MPSALIFRLKSFILYNKMFQGLYALSSHSTDQSPSALKGVPHIPDSPEQTLEKNVTRAIVLFCAIMLTGCTTAAPIYRSSLPHYRVGDCYRHPLANQGERIGQIQMVKDTQYYISVLPNGAGTYSYSDWISIAQLERISTPTPCPSGTPYPITLEAQPIERKEPSK